VRAHLNDVMTNLGEKETPLPSRGLFGLGWGFFSIWRSSTLTLSGHAAKVLAVAFSPDGKHLDTAGRGRKMRVYALETEELNVWAKKRMTWGWKVEECTQHLHQPGCPSCLDSPPAELPYRNQTF
jgi:WD40 repeat protein